MVKIPKRSAKYGVGKEIGGAIYVHRQYEDVLPEQAVVAKELVPLAFVYTVVKFDLKQEVTSFIKCSDFDCAHEPTVGESVSVKKDGSLAHRKPPDDPYVYHHKWLFVRDDYAGFDVQSSRTRSLIWTQLSDIDVRRIGRRSYWMHNVVPRISETSKRWLQSEEVCRILRISACELSHQRRAGRITYKKQGNTFFYKLSNQL
ncbi:MAG: hypothetical protein P1U77_29190 [Rubripirellula sp.]|nr:hypothetical protein [Rubripirellula sp.]